MVDAASSLLVSLSDDGAVAPASWRAGNCVGVEELAFGIAAEVETVAEVMGP